ncbi:DUF72 domain-containing protein [Pseudolysobacter antarcticus]|uniref:DUF72 domain-containing protein n=1 Tax=Pseudolysobacter antarcticus TaxID=2511995 RepID=A0A411HNG2_9GAMM|nr:DUF72 domain-containing protein [Pseudolysobacter antarcticus]QBB72018.1 DUF72 domain-containing protein [Pseudolysobacter antarcticus]
MATRQQRAAKSAPAADLLADAPVAPDGIRVGIGGWTFAPWRSNFYPAGLVQRRELEFASRHVNSIEINGTWYGAQKPATYAKWRDETPADFVFSAKAPQRITMSRTLAKTGGAIDDFLGDLATLGDKLGPVVWQFEKGRKLDLEDFAEFLNLLPKQINEHRMRHVLDVRDPDFVNADYIALARRHGMAIVFTDSNEYPSCADLSADFVYARLMQSRAAIETGYTESELQRWAQRARLWASGGEPDDLPRIAPAAEPVAKRDVFIYFISAAKERNPAAAMALLQHLGSR